jgi:adenosylmethionine-8-amino-7-oxononanoate aminotransferase
MDFDQIKAANAKYFWQPMAHPRAVEHTPPKVIVRGEGVYVHDIDGNKLLDGMGGLWNVTLGYGRAEINQAIMQQLEELPYYSSFRGHTNPRAIELARQLVELTDVEGMRRVLFGSGGSDAVDTALKVARQYWKLVGRPQKYKFISLRQGYHGTHFGGASLAGSPRFRHSYEPLLPGCSQVDAPWLYRNPYTEDPERLGALCAELLEREIKAQHPDTVAAFIAEPVIGSGGVIVPPPNYWPLVREVCDRNDVLLIADEVITGFGRSGSLFGVRGWGVRPDIMCLAKAITSGYIPLGATLVNERIAEAYLNDERGEGAIMHGYTYSGHPVACAAALACLELTLKEDLPSNAARMGDYLLGRLERLEQTSPLVGNVRGKGLMVCIELVADKKSRAPFASGAEPTGKVAEAAYRRGVLVRSSGPNLILSPPLVIQRNELDAIVEAMEDALAEVAG